MSPQTPAAGPRDPGTDTVCRRPLPLLLALLVVVLVLRVVGGVAVPSMTVTPFWRPLPPRGLDVKPSTDRTHSTGAPLDALCSHLVACMVKCRLLSLSE